jgi:hypothetical protein
VYGSIVWTAPDISFYMWCETFLLLLFLLIAGRGDFVYEYALLARISMASIVSWVLWNEALEKHLGSGNSIPNVCARYDGLLLPTQWQRYVRFSERLFSIVYRLPTCE